MSRDSRQKTIKSKNTQNELINAIDLRWRIPPIWVIAGIIVWTCIVLNHLQSGFNWGKYFDRWIMSPWILLPTMPAFLEHIKHLIIALIFTLALTGSGRLILQYGLQVKPSNRWEEIAISFSLGYGAWGTCLLLIGLAGLWHKSLLLCLLAIALIPVLILMKGLFLDSKSLFTLPTLRPTPLTIFAGISLCVVWLYHLRYALIPETFYDALQYHLGLPNLYLLVGKIIPTPENSFSGIPSLPEMLYGWTLVLDHLGISAGVVHCSMILWIAASFIGLSKRLGLPEAGVIASTIFYMSPVVMGESFRISVGLELTLMQLTCFTAFIAALDQAAQPREKIGWLIGCGSLLGFAMASKYTAWIVPVTFLPVVMYLSIFQGKENASQWHSLNSKNIGVIFSVSIAWLLPWVVKNVLFYRNPIFPFLNEIFAPHVEFIPNWKQLGDTGASLSHFSLTFRSIVTYLMHPWSLLRPPEDITESIGPTMLILLPLVFVRRFTDTEKILAGLCLGSWIPISLMTSVPRFFIPSMAIMILLISCILVGIKPERVKNLFIGLTCVICSVVGIAWSVMDTHRQKLDVFDGKKDYGSFLAHTTISYPAPQYAGMEYIESNTPANASILLFGDPRSFYIQRPFIATSSDQLSAIEVWANHSQDFNDLKNQFKDHRIKYILANFGEMSRRKFILDLSTKGQENLKAFWNRYALREFGDFSPPDRWVAVYKILEDSEASQPHPVDDLFSMLHVAKVGQ